MNYIAFSEEDVNTAILVKKRSLQSNGVLKNYIEPLVELGCNEEDFVAVEAMYNQHDKAPVKMIKEYLNDILPELNDVGVKYILVNDAAYFKVLANQRKAEGHYGAIYPCAIKGYEHISIVLGINYAVFYHNPDAQAKLNLSLTALAEHKNTGSYTVLGASIEKKIDYFYHVPDDSGSAFHHNQLRDIRNYLESLLILPIIEVDIEAFSLKFYEAGIGTISFGTAEGEAGVIQCDAQTDHLGSSDPIIQCDNKEVKNLLRDFFIEYKGKVTYHNGGYDAKVLIYELFMDHLQDYEGMLFGLEVMTRNIEDTKIIAYLATNSCAGNKLSLKDLALEYAGNYALQEINNICKIPLEELMRYNAYDCFATRFVREKYRPIMVSDEQEEIYNTIFIPSVKVLLQTELVGMPLDINEVYKVRDELTTIIDDLISELRALPTVIEFVDSLREEAARKKNLTLVKKRVTAADFMNLDFNPNSNPQVAGLLHDFFKLPIIDLTDTKQPAVGGKTLKKHFNTCTDPSIKRTLQILIEFAEVAIIRNTFINAFIENSVKKRDGVYWLHGSFNLGGTVSGRLSSKAPNLQNIPSTGSKYAKHIKRCFKAPEGWLFVGADFASLEDRISALTTKDPQKLKVYTDGYDGHCLRAFAYFPHRMPGIVEQMNAAQDDPEVQVKIINSIADLHEEVRQDSKAPTFLLTYGGTWMGLHMNVGLDKDEAKKIEANYHDLYKVSDEWVASKIEQATHDGYVTVAFGLRLRTPILKQTLINAGQVPYEAKKEARTAGNALGQSYGMLNNRAAIEFQALTLASPYRLDIMPCAPIHDAQYFVIRDDIDVVHWFNENLVSCMQWQELEEIRHPAVKLGGDVEIFWPSWAEKVSLPNGASKEEIINICGGS